MEIWKKADAELILTLYCCGSSQRTAFKIAENINRSYNLVLHRLKRLVSFGVIKKIYRDREVYYSRPKKTAGIKALAIVSEISIDAAKTEFKRLEAEAFKAEAGETQ